VQRRWQRWVVDGRSRRRGFGPSSSPCTTNTTSTTTFTLAGEHLLRGRAARDVPGEPGAALEDACDGAIGPGARDDEVARHRGTPSARSRPGTTTGRAPSGNQTRRLRPRSATARPGGAEPVIASSRSRTRAEDLAAALAGARSGDRDRWGEAFLESLAFVILTTPANNLVRPLHDRMPVLLSPEGAERWLARPDAALLAPAPAAWLATREVSANAVGMMAPSCWSHPLPHVCPPPLRGMEGV